MNEVSEDILDIMSEKPIRPDLNELAEIVRKLIDAYGRVYEEAEAACRARAAAGAALADARAAFDEAAKEMQGLKP